jgi:hypothetical protein
MVAELQAQGAGVQGAGVQGPVTPSAQPVTPQSQER